MTELEKLRQLVGKCFFIYFDKQLYAQILLDVALVEKGNESRKYFTTKILNFKGQVESIIRLRVWFNEQVFF